MIEWKSIENKLGDWATYFKPFYDIGGFEDIYLELRKQGKTLKLLPESKDLFKAFELCPVKDFKCVLLGMDPYPMVSQGIVVADGLAFSCSYTKKEQPSLKLIYDAIEIDICDGFSLTMLRDTDLTSWAKQGVLLLNSALTTVEGKPGAHKELWRPFMTFFFEEVLLHFSGIPLIFMGKQAQEYNKNLKNFHLLNLEHPIASAYQKREWNHENMFSWVNNILKQTNQEIDWVKLPF